MKLYKQSTTGWFDICIHCKIVTANQVSKQLLFFWWQEHLRSALSKFKVYNTVLLAIVIVLYIRP